MATVHPGATLVPHFRDFLPAWVSVQPWYLGVGTPTLTPVGYLRLEDPAGQVGIETHLVTDGTTTYQIPMTYRAAPIDAPLIAIAEHSVLGTRWIHAATADPVWRTALLRLVRTGATTDPSAKRGVAPAEGRGRLVRPFRDDAVSINLLRVPAEPPTAAPAEPPTARDDPARVDVVGLVLGTWDRGGGCLAEILRDPTS